MFLLLIVASFLFGASFGVADVIRSRPAHYIADKFPVRVIEPWERLAELSALVQHDFDSHRTASEVDVYVTPETLASLEQAGFHVVPVETTSSTVTNDKSALLEYHDYEALTEFLNDYHEQYPYLTDVFSLGRSVAGRELWGMEISDQPGQAVAGEPELCYFGNIHGDETVGREMLINLIALLLDDYGSDTRLATLVNTTRIFIVPSINPDGFEASRRSNNNGYDLNRDFPDQFQDPVDDPSGRQPETQAVMAFLKERNCVLSANLHGGTLCVNRPWDGAADESTCGRQPSLTNDEDVYLNIGLAYSIHNEPMYESNEFEDGLTNGAEWYCVYGGLQDYAVAYQGNVHNTMELSHVKNPDASALQGFWDDNRESLLCYMEKIHIGVKGSVTSSTGAPLQATIAVEGRPDFECRTHYETGYYHRLLLPGSYEITATLVSSGESQTQAVQVVDSGVAQLDFVF